MVLVRTPPPETVTWREARTRPRQNLASNPSLTVRGRTGDVQRDPARDGRLVMAGEPAAGAGDVRQVLLVGRSEGGIGMEQGALVDEGGRLEAEPRHRPPGPFEFESENAAVADIGGEWKAPIVD